MLSFHRVIYLVLIALALTLVACGGDEEPEPAAAFGAPLSDRVEVHEDEVSEPHDHLEASELTGEMQVVLVPTELVVGPNRFAVGLFDAEGEMLHDADVHLHYFDLSDPAQAVLESEADTYRVHTEEGPTTVFAHERNFERAGDWGVEVEARLPDGRAASSRIGFRVVADSASVGPGERVPVLKTPTMADVGQDLSFLTSASEPNPAFYELSLDQALSTGRPTMLLFATPAFCQTRFCGPAYEMVSSLQEQYGDRVNFIHIEVFQGLPNPADSGFKLSPVVEVFGLESEPWVYLIDRGGSVVYRFEGLFTVAELERQLRAHLGL